MPDEQLIRDIEAGLAALRAMSPEEWFKDAIRRGVIDEKGNVLIRMPEPPDFLKTKTERAVSPVVSEPPPAVPEEKQ